MYSFIQDLRYTFRALGKRPGFTFAAILTLSLGIGATTSIFSVVHSTMWRTLPVPDGDRMVSIVTQAQSSRGFGPLSFPDYEDYRNLDVFKDLAANITALGELTTTGSPQRALLTLTTGNYFDVLGLQPGTGRFYTEQEGGLGGEPVIVLSYRYWQTRFGGDPAVIGSTVSLNDLPVTILGVTPPEFNGTIGFAETNAYVPLSVWDQIRPRFRDSLEDRANTSWRVFGPLAPNVEIPEAKSAVLARSQTLERDYPETNAKLRGLVFPEPLTRLEPSAAAYLPMIAPIFMGLVALVLIIACANVASLLLAYAADRKAEVALRSALGASRWKIVRQLITESSLLALAGGILGLAIARWATVQLANVRVASDIPLFFDFSIDTRVFLFAVSLTLIAGILSGLAPGLQSSRTNLADTLKQGGRGASLGRQPLRSLLVTAQVAVSAVLLVCTALFTQSMWNVAYSDPGFELDNRFMLTVSTGLRNYPPEDAHRFFESFLQEVRSLPRVESAALGASVPVGFNSEVNVVQLPGEGEDTRSNDRQRIVARNVVSAGYFRTLGVEILEGRPIDETDREESRRVAVVNRRMAELWWPGESVLGQVFFIDGKLDQPYEVVGVAENGYYFVPGESPQPHFWSAYEQERRSQMTLFVESPAEMSALVPGIRKLVADLDPSMPVFDVRTLTSHYREGKAAILFGVPTALVTAFSVIGLVLAVTGLFGVISYSVSQRAQEVGIRMALGATRNSILGLLSRKGIVLAGSGIVLGLLGALVLTRGLASLLIGVQSYDPVTYGTVATMLLALTLLASFLPARFRLSRMNPVESLRSE